MKKCLFLFASLGFCLSLSTTAQAQRTSTSCGSDVTNLRVTLHGSPSNTVTHKLQSDRFNADGSPVPYVSQKLKGDTIEAMLQINNCSQDFTMNLNFARRVMRAYLDAYPNLSTSRFFNFDRVASVPFTPVNTTENPTAATDWANSSVFCTSGYKQISGFVVEKNPDGTYKDNYAGCGVDAEGRAFVRRSVGIQLSDGYRLRFQNSPVDGTGTLGAGSSYIRVYHYAADPANSRLERWELMPEETTIDGVTAAWGTLLFYPNKGAAYSVGYQRAPFHITVEKP